MSSEDSERTSFENGVEAAASEARAGSGEGAALRGPGSRKRLFVGRLGLVIAAMGAVLIVWALVILYFGDPVTASIRTGASISWRAS